MPLLDAPGPRISCRASFLELARRHILDWIVVVLLGGAFYGLHVLHPFQRFVGRYMLDDLRYPMKSSTVSFVYVPVISLAVPALIILCFHAYKRDPRDLHHALLGLAFSLALAGVVTNAIKVSVGRPRPDFFWRCFPDGVEIYTAIGEVLCTGDEAVIRDGHKSFPSGHASWCFAGLGYLSLYFAGKLQLFDHRREGQMWKFLIPFAPLAVAAYVSISRLEDYKHHWEDVCVAALIGMTSATLCYGQHFPSVFGAPDCKFSPAFQHDRS
ncbi:hypothetical protein SELMODRAFT_117725 [Selaginella moellendorffii]|uniref:Phosphatidic acid phosphatase type 2/haloperoxidase domain-containing protein n=1 Tax=Selaginella moellendorffii TaxID=88036 RepID=D8SIG4_SELML|nr:hypothetical protein SELMODRAFT_117725 [Selaginella moellendorffii]